MKELIRYLEGAKSVLILAHEGEDADALGSGLALLEVLRGCGMRADFLLSGDVERRLQFMTDTPLVFCEDMRLPEYELCFVLDCGDAERLGKRKFLLEKAKKSINLDHHYTNPGYAAMNWVDGEASSTGEILCALFEEMGVTLTASVAQNLYLAMMSDSGGLRYSCASPNTLRRVAQLMEHGFDHAELCRRLFDSKDYALLQLEAEATRHMHRYLKNRLAVITLPETLFERFSVEEKDSGDLVNLARSVAGVEIAVSLRETPEKIKVSFRSNGRYNVAELAAKIGGGGHAMAAGARITGKTLEEAEHLICALCEEILE